MQLYMGSAGEFAEQAYEGTIARQLASAFFQHFGRRANPAEVRSWQNSLKSMGEVLHRSGIRDQGVVVEHQLPQTSKRLDCMVVGLDAARRERAVVVELKQWDKTEPSAADRCVVTYVGGRMRDVLHPSVQVGQYAQYLAHNNTVFSEQGVGLDACALLHNLNPDPGGELYAPRHSDALAQYPIFGAGQLHSLGAYLTERVGHGPGEGLLTRVLEAPIRPSTKLLQHTAEMIKNQHVFVLLDEQLVVLERVRALAQRRVDRKKGKTVVLVRGGPGTGKSVVALHLVGKLSGDGVDVQHATGSRSFTNNIRKAVGSGLAAQRFRYFNNFAMAEADSLPVLVLDEAHRIRASSATRFTNKSQMSGKPQIEEIVDVAQVSVFFLDDLQVVRPNEVGSAALIRETAMAKNAELIEFELEAQFRCAGSDGYVNWVDHVLGIRETANTRWNSADDAFDFDVMDSVHALEAWVREKAQAGASARLVAGFCWPWSSPRSDGTLATDVVVDDWRMPWNAKPESGRLAAGIPTSDFWATDAGGLNQVGCVYTAQGFEFDYVGVVFGTDLRFDAKREAWIGDKSVSHDAVVRRSGDKFIDLVKHTYRVLLTRGMRGCRVVFLDPATDAYVRSRLGSEVV